MPTYLSKYAEQNGLKKVDAKSSLTVVLRPQDVRKSQLKSATSCAFARCAKETIPGVKSAHFFRSTAWLEIGNELVRYHLPPSVQKEIVSFDRSRAMAPGVYQLSKPVKSATFAEQRKRSKKRPGRHMPTGKGSSRRALHRTQGVRTLAGQGGAR